VELIDPDELHGGRNYVIKQCGADRSIYPFASL
jgi:hypothetical protein